MEKEFIPYQESLELKELGFDEPCLKVGNPNGCIMWKWIEVDGDPPTVNINDVIEVSYDDKWIQIPTYSQVFRWFRNKGFLISFSSHDKDTHEFYIKWISTKSILSNEYKTYEEAELECLRQLIKITKQSLYSIPIYENNIKTEHTVDGIIGDEKYFKLLEYGDGKNLPNIINVTLRNNYTNITLEK